MALDTRWKNPQGKSPEQLHDAIVQIVRELRKGDYLPVAVSAASGITYSNTTSGLTATDVQAAIDEAEGRIDTLEAASVIIASGTITNQANVDIALNGDTWDEVTIFLQALAPATDGVGLIGRFGQSGSFLSGASDYAWGNVFVDVTDGVSTAASTQDNSDSLMRMTGTADAGNAAGETASYIIRIPNPRQASLRKVVEWSGNWWNQVTAHRHNTGSGELRANSNVVDAFRVLFSSGNIASGYYKAIGRKFA